MANPNEQAKQQIVGLSKEDLISIIEAVRKPVKTDKEVRDEAQQEIDRKAMQETLRRAEENRLNSQKLCRHMRRDGSTQTVYITDLHRLYCQACAKWILPDAEPELFNTHYQLVY